MFSRFADLLRIFNRLKVGVDKNGNTYYRKPEKAGGGRSAEKRWVEFKGSPDVSTIPVEWNSWLSGQRKAAPTAQEMIDLETQRQNVKMRAALLQKEEEKQRYISRVSQLGQQADTGSPQDMEIIMRQIGSGETGESRPGATKAEEPSHTRYTKVREAKESVAWQPQSKSSSSSEPKGKGDDFEPGTWRP